MWRRLYGAFINSSPPYWATIMIALIGFGSNFFIERLIDRSKSYETTVSDLRGASGEFIALGGEFALPIIKKEKPDPDLRVELGKNILKQISITKELEKNLSISDRYLASKYIDELEKTKILIDKTSDFDQLQALYQRYSITRASWKRLDKAL